MTRAAQSPQIPPWMRPVRRRAGETQFGLLPGGPIVAGLTDAEQGLLHLVDGRPLDDVARLAAARGVDLERWDGLLDLLRELGVLLTHDDPGRAPSHAAASGAGRDRLHVVVEGSGSLVDAVVDVLRRTRDPRVTHGAPAVDAVVADPSADPVHLAVLVGGAALDPRRGDVWLAHGVPHLPVVPSGSVTTVGPLVEPGAGPCLWCLDLHRTDRDGTWPSLMAQVCDQAGLPSGDDRRARGAEAVAPFDGLDGLDALVAGTVTLYAGRLRAGERPPAGVSVEVGAGWPRMDHRRWSRHPRCTRHAAGGARQASPPTTPPCTPDTPPPTTPGTPPPTTPATPAFPPSDPGDGRSRAGVA